MYIYYFWLYFDSNNFEQENVAEKYKEYNDKKV